MIKSLLKLAIFLVAGILVYNYFFGTVEEKEQSKEIFAKTKDLGKSAWGLLKTEKGKLDDGKYDGALDKMGDLYESLEGTARNLKDSETLDTLAKLEKERKKLAENTAGQDDDEMSDADKQRIKTLLRKTEALMKQLEEE